MSFLHQVYEAGSVVSRGAVSVKVGDKIKESACIVYAHNYCIIWLLVREVLQFPIYRHGNV